MNAKIKKQQNRQTAQATRTERLKKKMRRKTILKRKRKKRHEGPNIANNRIIVYIPFNNLNVRKSLPQYIYDATLPEENTHLTKNWINKRIYIFMNFTLKSLLNQTNPNYLAYIVYHDSSKAYIKKALLNYPPLPFNINFVSSSHYEKAVIRHLTGYKYFYELHLYSDDMYHKNFINHLYHYKPNRGTQVLICQNGLIYNSATNQLAKYFNFSSSFNCLIYKVKHYLKGARHNIFKNSECGIWTGARLLPHEIIKEPVYMNHSHSANSAFFFEEEVKKSWVQDVWVNNEGQLALFGDLITNEAEKQRILEDFLGPNAGAAYPLLATT